MRNAFTKSGYVNVGGAMFPSGYALCSLKGLFKGLKDLFEGLFKGLFISHVLLKCHPRYQEVQLC